MLTIVHRRHLYFYTDGEYYQYISSPDGLGVDLIKKPERKSIENYTWENSETKEEPTSRTSSNDIQYVPLGSKSPGGTGGGNPRGRAFGTFTRVESPDESGNNTQPPKDHHNPNDKPHREHPNDKHHADPEEHFTKEKPVEKPKSTPKEEFHDNDIESDTDDSVPAGIFDLDVHTVDYSHQTLTLRKGDKCLTFFNGGFLLMQCVDHLNNQIFQLVNKETAESILRNGSDSDEEDVPHKSHKVEHTTIDIKMPNPVTCFDNSTPPKAPIVTKNTTEFTVTNPPPKKPNDGGKKLPVESSSDSEEDFEGVMTNLDKMLGHELSF